MTETRITGRLPQLDVEIRTGRDENAGAEWMTVSLRAVPSFEATARLFDPWLWWQLGWTLNPWLAWIEAAPRLLLASATTAALPARERNDSHEPRGQR